jgi:hypothetical protein
MPDRVDELGLGVGILRDPALHTEAERVATFEACGLGDRATYYRWKKKLQAVQ